MNKNMVYDYRWIQKRNRQSVQKVLYFIMVWYNESRKKALSRTYEVEREYEV